MKIVLSLLVLLTLQEAQAAEPVFVKTKEGCSAMLESITNADSVSWSGRCVDGLIEGVGIATYVKDNKKISFIEEYMGGVRAYPYVVDKNGAVRLGGGPEAPILTMETCKKLDQCTALYDYAMKNKKRLSSMDNRIGKDIEIFGQDRSLAVIGGGKFVRIKHEQGYIIDSDYSGVQATAAPTKKTSGGTADGLDFSMQNGLIVATGGPCTAPGLYKVSVGELAFEKVKNGTFREDYYLDGVMHSSRGFDIHTFLSPNVDWQDTTRQNRKEADDIPRGDPEKEDAEKEAGVVECLARSQTQYAIAFENWMKANMHLCKTCSEDAKTKKTYSKKTTNKAHCPTFVTATDHDTSGTRTLQWEISPDVKANAQALGELLEHLKSIRDCTGRCGGSPEEIVPTSRDTFISLYGESFIADEPWRREFSTIPFIKMVSCELGIPYNE